MHEKFVGVPDIKNSEDALEFISTHKRSFVGTTLGIIRSSFFEEYERGRDGSIYELDHMIEYDSSYFSEQFEILNKLWLCYRFLAESYLDFYVRDKYTVEISLTANWIESVKSHTYDVLFYTNRL